MEEKEVLNEIRDLLKAINAREDTKEVFAESDALFKKFDQSESDSLSKIQTYFDRIHDKLFTFNSILIATFFGFSKFLSDKPIFETWVALLPISNLLFLLYLEYLQLGIFRFLSNEKKWTESDRTKYGKKINRQNLRSLLAIIITVLLFAYLGYAMIVF